MGDIDLDDLIEKDKKLRRAHKKPRGAHKPRGGFSQRPNFRDDRRDTPFRGNRGGRGNRPNEFRNRGPQRDTLPPLAHKNKPIQKVRNGRIIRRNNLVQDDTFVRDRRPDEQREVRSVQPKQEELTNEKGRTLKVMGLHPDCTNEDLYKLFSAEGALEKCIIEQDNFGRSLTTALVKYHNTQSALNAIQNINNQKVMNSVLTVEPYRNIRRN